VLDALRADPAAREELRALLKVDALQPQRPPDPDVWTGVRVAAAYTTTTLGDELGVSPKTIRNWIRSGRLAAVRQGRRYVVAREAVEALSTPRARPENARPRSPRPRAGVLTQALEKVGDGR
jgi:excisionase family DNA binding protein